MARMSRSFGRDRNAEGKSGTTKRPSPPVTKSRLSDQKQHMTRSHGRSGVKLSACHVLPCHPQAFTKIFTWPRVSRWLIRRILQMSPRRISKAFDTQIAYIVLRLCSQRLRVTMWTYATICNYSACMWLYVTVCDYMCLYVTICACVCDCMWPARIIVGPAGVTGWS